MELESAVLMVVCYLFAIKMIRLLFGVIQSELSLVNGWLHLMCTNEFKSETSAYIVYLSKYRLQSWGQILYPYIEKLIMLACHWIFWRNDRNIESWNLFTCQKMKCTLGNTIGVLRYQWRCPGIDGGDSERVRCLIFCSRRYCNALNPWYWRWIDCFASLYDAIYVTFSAVVAAQCSIKWMKGTRESNRM